MVHEPTLRQVALDYPVEKRVLEHRVEQFSNALQDKLGHHYAKATSDNRDGIFLIDESADYIVFGLRSSFYNGILRSTNTSKDDLEPIREYYRTRARTILSDEIVDSDILLVCLPVIVEMPDWWDDAATYLQYKLKHLVDQGLSPAEALDHFAVEYLPLSNSAWSESRGVSSVEAVRKNNRQAKEKLADDD